MSIFRGYKDDVVVTIIDTEEGDIRIVETPNSGGHVWGIRRRENDTEWLSDTECHTILSELDLASISDAEIVLRSCPRPEVQS